MKKFITDLVRRSGKILKKRFTTAGTKSKSKTDVLDLVTEADLAADKFVIVAGNKLKKGGRQTREAAIHILNIANLIVQKNSWLLVDEALENISDELFENYLELKNKGVNIVLSDVSLINLSENERNILLSYINSFVVYKIRNIDAQWLEKANKKFNAKSIASIKQFHYQYLSNGELEYSPSTWPLKEI